MTVSLNLSQKPKIVIIHGMNNNHQTFQALGSEFSNRGFEVEFIILPGHEKGKEELTSSEAISRFTETFKRQVSYPYIAVAYSQGALYYELTLNLGMIPKPQKALYLAPAFFAKSTVMLNLLIRLLSKNMRIRSFSPKELTRYDHMLMHEYKTLMDKMKRLSQIEIDKSVSRLIVVDPKDELVDPQKIFKKYPNATVFHARKLKEKFRHHLIFHPKYSSPDEWHNLMSIVFDFVSSD